MQQPPQRPTIIQAAEFPTFDFNKLNLEGPISIPNGAHFTKLLYYGRPLVLQTTHATTKQGLVKSGKKYYTDLVFDMSSEQIIHWFENLEKRVKDMLYENGQTWFETPLSKDDIDDVFVSILKVYRSGKFYTMRTGLKMSKDGESADVKIYNENYTPVAIEAITNETEIMSVIEVKGIKFTSKNFQIDFEIRQILVLDDDKVLDDFVITRTTAAAPVVTSSEQQPELTESLYDVSTTDPSIVPTTKELPIAYTLEELCDNVDELAGNIKAPHLEEEVDDAAREGDEGEYGVLSLQRNTTETMELSPAKDIYFNLYKEARTKAKEAKIRSIIAFLEAKKIRNTYMIELQDTSDLDDEIEYAEEAELEKYSSDYDE